MSELGVFAYCAAIGFVTAGALGTFYQLVTSKRPDFAMMGGSLPGITLTVILSMFAGPFIVAQKLAAGLRSREIKILPAALGAVLAGMWSVCAGVFYLSLMLGA